MLTALSLTALCLLDIDECGSSPCMSGGTCLDEVNRYTCQCVDGFTSINCEAGLPFFNLFIVADHLLFVIIHFFSIYTRPLVQCLRLLMRQFFSSYTVITTCVMTHIIVNVTN